MDNGRPLRCEHRLGMKLQTAEVVLSMSDSHHMPVAIDRQEFEGRWQGLGYDPGMIVAYGKL